MIRIIGIQRSFAPEREFVLLQNQGGLRVNLRGHVVLGEQAVESSDLTVSAHVFNDDALIPPGMYVVLYTGVGEPRWGKTKDGALVYYTFMNRPSCVWESAEGPIHLLGMQHSYAERAEALTLR